MYAIRSYYGGVTLTDDRLQRGQIAAEGLHLAPDEGAGRRAGSHRTGFEIGGTQGRPLGGIGHARGRGVPTPQRGEQGAGAKRATAKQ